MEGVALVVSGPPVLALSGALDLPLAAARRMSPVSTTVTSRLRLEPIDLDRADDLWLLHQDPGIAGYDGIWSRDKAERRVAGSAECGVSWASGETDRGAQPCSSRASPGVNDDAPFALYALSADEFPGHGPS